MASTATVTVGTGDADLGLTPDVLRQMYEEMLLARLLDERMLQLNRIGKAPFVISCQGQEAAQIGAAFALDKEKDWFLPYYRDLAVCVHAGMTARDIMLNLFAKPDDPNSGGRQMPGHYGSRRLHIVTQSSPVATQLVHATGVAYAAKLRREDSIAYTSVGEGGTSTGEFHEALNFAAIHKLPVLFFVENNQYAISVPQEKQMAIERVADRAAGYGMPGVTVDGNDVFATFRAVQEAVTRARRGEGPTLVEAMVQRFQPHSGDDDDKYRSREEVAAMRARDPLVHFRRALEERGVLDGARVAEITARLRAAIDEATAFADAAPDADPGTITDHVFAMTEWLREEQPFQEQRTLTKPQPSSGVVVRKGDFAEMYNRLRVLRKDEHWWAERICTRPVTVSKMFAAARTPEEFFERNFVDVSEIAFDLDLSTQSKVPVEESQVAMMALYPSNALRSVAADISRIGTRLQVMIDDHLFLMDPDAEEDAGDVTPTQLEVTLFAVDCSETSHAKR